MDEKLEPHAESAGSHSEDEDSADRDDGPDSNQSGNKKGGRRRINIEFIEDKSRRHITFSKRKAGIMKKAYELSTLTGTQILLLVASETGHVYTFATPKLQPLITKQEGKALIQECLNAPENVAQPEQPNNFPNDNASIGFSGPPPSNYDDEKKQGGKKDFRMAMDMNRYDKNAPRSVAEYPPAPAPAPPRYDPPVGYPVPHPHPPQQYPQTYPPYWPGRQPQ